MQNGFHQLQTKEMNVIFFPLLHYFILKHKSGKANNEWAQTNYLVLLLPFIVTGPCSSVTAYKTSLPKKPTTNLPEHANFCCQTQHGYYSIPSEKWPNTSFSSLDVKESITSRFCPFSTQTHITAYSKVRGQSSTMSAELLNHRKHTQN